METKVPKTQVTKLAPFSYRLKGSNITEAPQDKRRGFIYEGNGEVLTIPFNSNGRKRGKRHEIRSIENGKLTLSPNRQRIKLEVSFDRLQDSEDNFISAVNELINGYEMEVIKYETEECLELDT